MTALLTLAARSAWNRRFVLALVVLSIALSTFLLLGIERLRQDLRANFSQAVSGTDLIVGARTGPVQLLLYAVFRIGNATNNIRYSSAEAIAQHRGVAWMVPLSLGDSHRGFAVLGTTTGYFEHFRHGQKQRLVLAQGQPFDALYDTVVGAEVARRLGYTLGQRIVLSHGDGALQANDHADKPFTIVGILAPTGTPVDRTVHISLQAMEAIHVDWQVGAPLPGQAVSAEQAARMDLTPRTITAALVGLKSRAAVFAVQRDVAAFRGEPLLAILRAVGAGPRQMLALLAAEGLLVTASGVVLGALACWGTVALAGGWVQSQFGITLQWQAPGQAEWQLMAAVLAGGLLASLVPGWRAYRLSLADGLSPRI